jgi:DNA-3-methyladenine glycosylase II
MTASDYAKARRVLARRDPVIRDLMRRFGECGLAKAQRSDPFRALLHAIIAQQLSTKAAATIEGRFAALFDGRPTAVAIAAMPDERLRAVGISPQKLGYIRDLCARTLDGSLTLDALDTLSDEDVIVALTSVKGIGRWTAEMFLKAVQRAYKLRLAPTPVRLTRLGENWRPYRSVACWYLWASLDNTAT